MRVESGVLDHQKPAASDLAALIFRRAPDTVFRVWAEEDSCARLIVTSLLVIAWANSAARALLAGRKVLLDNAGVLGLSHPGPASLAEIVDRARFGQVCHVITAPRPSPHIVLRAVSVVGDIDLIGITLDHASTPNQGLHREMISNFELTPSESDVLGRILSGSSAKMIARERNTAIATVRAHIENSYRKMHISSREELFSIAAAYGHGPHGPTQA